ncbi:MAG: hypothetical protein ACT4PG_12250 [Panacagrimonas sp.]
MRRDVHTADLFEVPRPANPLPGTHDYRAQVSGLVADVLKAASSDRFAVAGQMARLTGKDISKHMLDAYTSEAREEFNLPFYLVPALEVAAGTHLLTAWLADVRGGRLLIGREALNAELGRLEKLREDTGCRIRDLKRRMGEGE